MSSILTNSGAITALQTLKTTNSSLVDTQDMISTGKKVESAKDNAAIWAISKTMEADVSGFEQISESLALGESTLSVASKAAEDITEILNEISDRIIAAQSDNVAKATLQEDLSAYVDQIQSTVDAAQFNGKSLVQDGSTDLTVLASLNRDTAGAVTTDFITVSAVSLDTTSGPLAALATLDVVADSDAALTAISGLKDIAISTAASFGSSAGRLEMQSEFVSNLTDTLTLGISSLVDADMEEASAKLSALQVQQDLGVQALSIANEAPESLLTLFR